MRLGVWRAAPTAAQFCDWLEAPVSFFEFHTERWSWDAQIASVRRAARDNAGRPEQIIWSISPVLDDGSLAAAANGRNDAEYRRLAVAIRTAEPRKRGPIHVRVGHEFNGAWWPWHAQNAQRGEWFKAMWRRVFRAFLGVSSRFRLIWCANGTNDVDPELAWPGRRFVHMIGMDLYYLPRDGTNNGDGRGFFNWTRPVRDWLVAKGRAENRPICIPEWGIEATRAPVPDGECASEDFAAGAAEYARLFVRWMVDNGVTYSSIWDSNSGVCGTVSSGQYPLLGDVLRTELRRAATQNRRAA